MIAKDAAPKSVQEFRKTVRRDFRRGVNETADLIIDDLIVWLIDDVFSGEIKTREEAAKTVGLWMSLSFPEKNRKA